MDPFVFGPPGTVIIFMDPDPYINKQKFKKILNFNFLLFCEFDFLFFETDDDVPLLPSKVNILNEVP